MGPAALVLDGETKSALAAARALGARNIDIVAGSSRSTAPTRFSRYVRDFFVYPSPLADAAGFVEAVIAAAKRLPEPPVVLCFSDAALLSLSRARERVLKHARILLSSETETERAFSKSETMALASDLGIPVPKTWTPERTSALAAVMPSLSFPVVVKPRHSASWLAGTGARGTVDFAHSADDLAAKFSAMLERTGEPPLLQEFVRGEELGVEALALDGEIEILCSHRRLRSLSPRGGAAVLKEIITPPSDIRAHAVALLRALKWTGVAMIEFTRDDRTGVTLLLEINGRFWGSLPLAIRAGFDFPGAYYDKLVSGQRAPPVYWRPGVRTRHLLGDVHHLLLALFAFDPMRPHLYPTRGRALRDFLTAFTVPEDVFALHDLKPSFAEVADSLLR